MERESLQGPPAPAELVPQTSRPVRRHTNATLVLAFDLKS